MLSPITPHFCDVMWVEDFLPSLPEEERKVQPELASVATYPQVDKSKINYLVLKKYKYVD